MVKQKVPIWKKSNLTLQEAAQYSGIGINKLRQLSETEDCPFVLWNGSKRLIKRQELDKYINKAYSINAIDKLEKSCKNSSTFGFCHYERRKLKWRKKEKAIRVEF